ncbi:hypothetical protein BBJ28_00023570 [Nothophytophthora sp. Chile5]|nr:hypothetical protein BBJ28_00023570 [Nothophytophthora sp. Chile5]
MRVHKDLLRGLPVQPASSEQREETPAQGELIAKRRRSLDNAADRFLARLSEAPTESLRNSPHHRRATVSPHIQPRSCLPRKESVKVSSDHRPSRSIRRARSARSLYLHESFYDAYGYLGLVMLLAFLLSFMAMVYMVIVQVYPVWTANYLLNTDTLDNGEFLLISKPSQALAVASAFLLALFACLYAWLIFFMLSYHNKATVASLSQPPDPKSLLTRLVLKVLPLLKRHQARYRSSSRTSSVAAGRPLRKSNSLKALGGKMRRASSFHTQLATRLIFNFTSMEGAYHHYYDAMLDFPKLIFQTMSLTTYLSKGFPLPLICFYALPLGFNWLVSFYRFQRNAPDPALIVARSFYLFDLFFAVFAPVVMLLYSYYNFSMDRKRFATREETLTPGSFDRIARLFADPIEVELFLSSFANLQITEAYYLVVKSFLNLLGIFKWKKVITHLILAKRSRQRDGGNNMKHQGHSRAHVMYGGVIFICCCLGVAIYTAIAITTSIKSCALYHHCAVYSYHVQWGETTTCPCIVFIDRELIPRTFDEWIHAPDVTEDVRTLAANGYLQTVQIINRALPTLPDELRLCTKLKDLYVTVSSVEGTKTDPSNARRCCLTGQDSCLHQDTEVPRLGQGVHASAVFVSASLEWPGFVDNTSHTHRLSLYASCSHVENDFTRSSLQYLPPDMFTNMHGIRFIRTGGASGLTEFPSLDGLHELSTLVLSIVRGLHELPRVDDLSGLTTFYVADATHVPRLPSLVGLTSLKSFAVFRRNEICCNGWATGVCDLTNFQCMKRENETEVQCVTDRIPDEDMEVVHRTGGFLCGTNITQDLEASEPTLESTDGLCQGVLYHECHSNGKRGICYNGRMQVVHCDVFGEYEKMRRLQIARKVGDVCVPEVEAWLGCPNATV